jgi:hypothetical protein
MSRVGTQQKYMELATNLEQTSYISCYLASLFIIDDGDDTDTEDRYTA